MQVFIVHLQVLRLVPFSVLCLVLEMVRLMVLSVSMMRKADRLGFIQVVQCKLRWVLRIRNVCVWLVYYYYVCLINVEVS